MTEPAEGEPQVRRWTEQRWVLDNVVRSVGSTRTALVLSQRRLWAEAAATSRPSAGGEAADIERPSPRRRARVRRAPGRWR
jgi:hypothetical protein